jgi:anti-sigma B factor antagonist
MSDLPERGAPSLGGLGIRRTVDAEGVVLALDGELDLASAPELERQLREISTTNRGRLLIDLGGLTFMDSTGLGVILGAQRSTEAAGNRFSLRSGQKQVQRLFAITGMADRFTFEEE